MPSLELPYLSVAVALPLLAALLMRVLPEAHLRATAVGVGATTMALLGAVLAMVQGAAGGSFADPWSGGLLAADALNAAPMALFAALTLAAVTAMPRQDATRRNLAVVMVLLGATLATYSEQSLMVLGVAWTVGTLPFVMEFAREANGPQRGRTLAIAALMASIVAMAAAVGLLASEGGKEGPAGVWAFGCLMLAVALRKGIFPVHSWVVSALDQGPLAPVGLLVNAHAGAFVVLRVIFPRMPELARASFPLLTDLALFTALYAAVVALRETRARRIMGLLIVSQSASVLAGIETVTVEGLGGAMVLWMVVAVASMGMLLTYRALEVRFGSLLEQEGMLGLAGQAPRLAVFFAVSGLALVGLPGTLGFCAEDLLLHATLTAHPIVGLALPLATAFNAIQVLRLLARLFLGKRTHADVVGADALPRERWVLTAVAVFLVVGGVFPGAAVKLYTEAARQAVSFVESQPGGGPDVHAEVRR